MQEVVTTTTTTGEGTILSTTGSLASTLGPTNSLCYRGYVYDTETTSSAKIRMDFRFGSELFQGRCR